MAGAASLLQAIDKSTLKKIFDYCPALHRFANQLLTNNLASATSARPNSGSLWSPINNPQQTTPSDYLTWHTVTDKNYFDLHLLPAPDSYIDSLPNNASSNDYPLGQITELFRRQGSIQEGRSSVFFMFFAQWFTDGFFRSDPHNERKTTSAHNIDLSQIYGANEAVSQALRSGSEGKLKSQMINGEEFPDYLGELDQQGQWQVKPCYQVLPYIAQQDVFDSIYGGLNDQQKSKLFATGLERGNAILGHNIISTLFLREHNHICDELKHCYPQRANDDNWLFHKARIINTIILMKLVIEEYVNHIAGVKILLCDPSFAERQDWYRAPWIAAEFNLLYRWHGLVPDSFELDGEDQALRQNHGLLEQKGMAHMLAAASRQTAGKISLENIPEFLLPAEQQMINKGREWHLRCYNDYRQAFNLKRLTSFEQLGVSATLANKLQQLYGHIDQLELTVGLFAESSEGLTLTGNLQTKMVAYDAITQIYTNPLFAKHNFTEAHFTHYGIQRIQQTHSFQQLVNRNSPTDVTIQLHSE